MEPGPETKVEVELLAAGEPAAYAALYARLARPLLRVAGAMLGDAGDAVHDVFVALARGRERLRHDGREAFPIPPFEPPAVGPGGDRVPQARKDVGVQILHADAR